MSDSKIRGGERIRFGFTPMTCESYMPDFMFKAMYLQCQSGTKKYCFGKRVVTDSSDISIDILLQISHYLNYKNGF